MPAVVEPMSAVEVPSRVGTDVGSRSRLLSRGAAW